MSNKSENYYLHKVFKIILKQRISGYESTKQLFWLTLHCVRKTSFSQRARNNILLFWCFNFPVPEIFLNLMFCSDFQGQNTNITQHKQGLSPDNKTIIDNNKQSAVRTIIVQLYEKLD